MNESPPAVAHGQDLATAPAVLRARIKALEHRIAALDGELRDSLEERLKHLKADLALRQADPAVQRPAPTPNPMGELLAYLAATRAAREAPRDGDDPTGVSRRRVATAMDEVRQVSAQVRAQSQLRQALTSAPPEAGPLNSASVVHRALTRMHALSPAYVQHFIAYADALSALEPFCTSPGRTGETVPRAAGNRGKPRSRTRRT